LIADIQNKAALYLTEKYGKGHWSYKTTTKSVMNAMKGKSKVLIAKNGNTIAGTLCLQTKKPWAIDINYFTKVQQPIYLIGMAVHPDWQRKGIGKFMMQEVKSITALWPANSVRLDAYDNKAGAGDFYRKCGYSEKGRVLYKGNPLLYFELLI
jgi:GNAT superfamily N-acetyltransferase